MRYGIVSDVHANIQAWKAVLRDMRKEGVDAVLCLGDVIGYGPNPVEVLDSCYEHVDYFILGNHDAVIGNRLNSSLFNDNAKFLIEWTRDQLSDSAADFFSDMPLRMEGDGFVCAHAELAMPGRFNYIYEAQDAIESFTSTEAPVMFVGHTHFPAKFRFDLNSNLVHQDLCTSGYLQTNERYLINVGSVGDPRDGNTTASYCIYDADKNYITYRQVPFDIKGFRRNLLKAELPIQPYFLSVYDGSEKEGQTIKDMAVMEGNEAQEASAETHKIHRGQDVKTSRQKVSFSLDDVQSSKKSKAAKEKKKKSEKESKRKGLKVMLSLLLITVLGAGGFFIWEKLKDSSGSNTSGDTANKPGGTSEKSQEQSVVIQKPGTDIMFYLDTMKKPELASVENGSLINWKDESDNLAWKVRIKKKGWYKVFVDHKKDQGEAQVEIKMGSVSKAAVLKKSDGEQELILLESPTPGEMNFSISLAASSENEVSSLSYVRLQYLGEGKPFDFDEEVKSLGGFESGTYQGWIAYGPAFGFKPFTENSLPEGIEIKGIRKKYFAASLSLNKSSKGALQTPPFEVRHKTLAILAAGGEGCEINLYVEGQLAETHQFSKFPELNKIFFDLKHYAGQKAYLELVDKGKDYMVFDDVILMSSEASSFEPGPSVSLTGKKSLAKVNDLNKFLKKAGEKLIKKNFKGCLSDLEEASFVTGVNLNTYKSAVNEISDFEQFLINTFKKDLKRKTIIIPKGLGVENTVFVVAVEGKKVEVIVDGSTNSTSLGMQHLSEEGIRKRVAEDPLGLLAYHINKEDIEEKIESIRYSSKNPIGILVNAAKGGLKVKYPEGAVVGSSIEIWAMVTKDKAQWSLSLSSSNESELLENVETLDITQVYPAYKTKGMSKKPFNVYRYDLSTEKYIKEISFKNTQGELNSMLLIVRNSQGQIVWQKSFNENEADKNNLLRVKAIKLYKKESQPEWENLALGKPSTASDPHSGAFVGINDGIWAFTQPFVFGSSKKETFPKYVTVDLEAIKKINALRFGIPNRGSTKNISLQYSGDNSEFKTIMNFEFKQGLTERYCAFFETIEARYIRIRFNENYETTLNRAVNTHVFISELEAYLLD